jgi:hypothetical protein
MSSSRVGVNVLKFNDIGSLPALFAELQLTVYALLPDQLKAHTSNGQTLNLSKDKLGFNPGEYPYQTVEELHAKRDQYSDNAVCLVYEALLILNQSGVLNTHWSQGYRVTLLAAVSKLVGLKNLNAVKNYLSSLAEKDKWAPSAVNEKSFQLGFMMRQVVSQILAKNLIPLADKSLRAMAEEGLRALGHDLNVNLYHYQVSIFSAIQYEVAKLEGTLEHVSQSILLARDSQRPVAALQAQLEGVLQFTNQYREELVSLQEVNNVLADWNDNSQFHENPNRRLHQSVAEQIGMLAAQKRDCENKIAALKREAAEHLARVAIEEEKSIAASPVSPISVPVADPVPVSVLVSGINEQKEEVIPPAFLHEELEAVSVYNEKKSPAVVSPIEISISEESPESVSDVLFDSSAVSLVPAENTPVEQKGGHYNLTSSMNDGLDEAEDEAEEKGLVHAPIFVQHGNPDFAYAEMKSPAFNLILKKLNAHNWTSAFSQFLNASKLKEISLDVTAFTRSILELLGDGGKQNVNDADLLPMLIELMPNDRNYLNSLAERLDQIINMQRDMSQLGNHMALLLVAIKAKIDGIDKPHLANLPADNQRLQVIFIRLNTTYQLNQNLCRLLESTDNYLDSLANIVQQEIAKKDPTDYYFNDGKNPLDAIIHDHISEEKDNKIKALVENDPVFESLLVKYRIMTELKAKLVSPRKSARERFVDYYEHLDNNYELLNKNRDSRLTTFLKVVGFILSTALPLIGNFFAYSKLFVSNGSRYVSAATGKRHLDVQHDETAQQTNKRSRV